MSQGVDGPNMRNLIAFERSQDVDKRIHLAQMADVGGLFQRVLADGAYVDVFHRGVRQLLRVVERGQFIEALVGDFRDSDVGLARVRKRALGKICLGQNAK